MAAPVGPHLIVPYVISRIAEQDTADKVCRLNQALVIHKGQILNLSQETRQKILETLQRIDDPKKILSEHIKEIQRAPNRSASQWRFCTLI